MNGADDMKLWVCLCFCLMLITSGCRASVGNFHDDSLNMTVLSDVFDEKISAKEWNIDPLLESYSIQEAEMLYGIEDSFCEEVLIRRALSDAACEEIVIVHAKDQHQKDIMKQFQTYQQDRAAAFARLVNQQAMVQQAITVNYGNYVIFVCSKDQTNVLQYMRSLSA